MEEISCVLWYAGDKCSQVALERVRENPELSRATQLADARVRSCRPPAHVRLVPTLTVRRADGRTCAYTGKQIYGFAQSWGAREHVGDRASLHATDLRYALGSRGGLETFAELMAETDIQ